MLTHVHYCKHCDTTSDCVTADCNFSQDWSKQHGCMEREDSNRRLRRMLGKTCKFSCGHANCSHPQRDPELGRKPDKQYQRPRMVEFNGRWVVLAKENAESIERFEAYKDYQQEQRWEAQGFTILRHKKD